MSLDLFPQAIAASDQAVAASAAPDLPAGFSEALGASWQAMTEWHSSTAYENARERALASYYDDVKARTGESLPLYGLGGGVSLDDLNAGIAKLRDQRPDDGFMPLSEADIDTMARRRMAAAHDAAAQLSRRETTWGGTLGNVVGTLAGGMTDPVMLATLPLGGAGQAGIALRTLEFAAIAGGTEAATAALTYRQREAAVPGSAKDIPGEIAAATLFGGVFGAGFGSLQKLLGAGRQPLPTTVREEVNAATSEAQFAASNPFPTAAGEAAARDAQNAATRSMLRDEPVRAGDDFAAAHVADYAAAAKADTPEALALAGEQHLRPETFGEVPQVERFDALPAAGEDAASYWERRIADASPEERAALGATDAVAYRLIPTQTTTPLQRFYDIADADGKLVGGLYTTVMGDVAKIENVEVFDGANALGPGATRQLLKQFRELNPEVKELTGERISGARFGGATVRDGEYVSVRLPDVAARDLAPEEMAKLAADPQTEQAVLRNLDRIRVERPEGEFTVQVKQPDGSYQFVTRKLEDVLSEIDAEDALGQELLACATGMMAAE